MACGLCCNGEGGCGCEVLGGRIAAGIHVDGGGGWEESAENAQGMLGVLAFGKEVVQMGWRVKVWRVALDEKSGERGRDSPAEGGGFASSAGSLVERALDGEGSGLGRVAKKVYGSDEIGGAGGGYIGEGPKQF